MRGTWMKHRLLNKYLILLDVGGLLYILLELLWRGQSHWSMFVLGGVCFVALGLINEVLSWCATGGLARSGPIIFWDLQVGVIGY